MRDEISTITTEMIKIGDLNGRSAGGPLYQDGESFFYQVEGWTMKGFDEVVFKKESERFSSLHELLSTLPIDVHFQPEGTTETIEEKHHRVRLLRKIAEHPNAAELVSEIRSEYGLNDLLEIGKIFEARTRDLPALQKDALS